MAIPDKIKQLANKVRNEIFGKDVRESIAQSMEVTGETAEEAKQRSVEQLDRVDRLIRENPQPSEVVDARGNYPLLGSRLDSVTSQLAENEYLANSLKNSKADKAEVQTVADMLDDIIVSNGDGSKDTELVASRGSFDTLVKRLDTKDGVIKNIEETILKFENEVDNGDFSQDGSLGSGLYRWLTSGTISLLSATENILKVEPNPNNANGRIYVGAHWLEIPANHVFYICFLARASGEGTFNLSHGSGSIGSSTTQSTDFNVETSFTFYSQVFKANANGTRHFRVQSHDFTETGDFFEMQFVSIVDLTKAFGAGNEPSKKSLDKVMPNIGWFDALKYIPNNDVLEMKISSLPTQGEGQGIKGITVVNGEGDGMTDDSNAIQSALNAGKGGTVLLPPGTYLVSRTLYIPDNTIFVGAGLNSKIKLAKNHLLDSITWRTFDGGYIIKPILTNNRDSSQAKNIIVKEIAIDGQGVNDSERMGGLIFADAYNCHAERVFVEYINWTDQLNINSRGFNIACVRSEKISFINTITDYAGYECIGTFDDSKDVLVQGNFIGTGRRCSAQIHRNNFNITFDSNFMKQNQEYFADAHGCLVIHGSSTRPADGLTITNNFFEEKTAYAVVSFVEYQRDVIFSGNQINGEDIIGLRINGDNKDFTVIGNKIRVNRTGITATCQGSLLITDNDIKAATLSGDGITLNGVDKGNLQGNSIETGRHGVSIASVGTGIMVNQNIITAGWNSFAADYSSDPKIMIGQNIA